MRLVKQYACIPLDILATIRQPPSPSDWSALQESVAEVTVESHIDLTSIAWTIGTYHPEVTDQVQ